MNFTQTFKRLAEDRVASALLVLLICAAFLRFMPFALHHFQAEFIKTADSQRYLDLSDSLAKGHFNLPGSLELLENPWPYELFRTPGYPVFLLGIKSINRNYLPGLFGVQIILDLIFIIICFMLARRWAGARAGIVAAFFATVDVSHIAHCNLIMSDILCTTLLSLAFWHLLVGRSWPVSALMMNALLLSLAFLVRPLSLPLVGLFAVYLLFQKVAWAKVLLFVLLAIAIPFSWLVRNHQLSGDWILSSAYEFNLNIVMASKLKAYAEGISRQDAEAVLTLEARQRLSELGLSHWREVLTKTGSAIFSAERIYLPWLIVRSTGELLFAGERRLLLQVLGRSNSERSASIGEGPQSLDLAAQRLKARPAVELMLVLMQIAFNFLIWVLAICGLIFLYRNHQRRPAFLISASILYFIAASLVVASARMRLPFSALLFAVAACGANALWEYFQSRKRSASRQI